MGMANAWRETRRDMAGEARDLLDAYDLRDIAEHIVNAGFASVAAISHMDENDMDAMELSRERRPVLWGAIQAAKRAAAVPGGSAASQRAASSLARMAAAPFSQRRGSSRGGGGQYPPRSASVNEPRGGPPMKLGRYDLTGAGGKVDIEAGG